MTVKELIEALQGYNENREVMIIDGFNGKGVPRTINYGPSPLVIQHIDADDTADCECRVGESVLVIGFGCY